MKSEYLVFIFDDFYPQGGMNDLKGTFDTKDKAFNFILKSDLIICDGNAQIVFENEVVLELRFENQEWMSKVDDKRIYIEPGAVTY